MRDPLIFSLAGKRVWIFGGAGYLGSAIVEALDTQAAKTICVDIENRALDLVQSRGLRHTTPLSLDTSRVAELEGFVADTVQEYGLPDGVVNLTCASSVGKSLVDLTSDDFQKPFIESVSSFFMLARALAELMVTRGSGSFVHFASMYGVVSPDPSIYQNGMEPNPIEYGTSKAAILQMSRYLAVHYGTRGLRFNCVAPGPFPNPTVQANHPDFVERLSAKTPLQRFGVNHEIIGPTLFLLSDAASYVTGQSLAVDGGWTAW